MPSSTSDSVPLRNVTLGLHSFPGRRFTGDHPTQERDRRSSPTLTNEYPDSHSENISETATESCQPPSPTCSDSLANYTYRHVTSNGDTQSVSAYLDDMSEELRWDRTRKSGQDECRRDGEFGNHTCPHGTEVVEDGGKVTVGVVSASSSGNAEITNECKMHRAPTQHALQLELDGSDRYDAHDDTASERPRSIPSGLGSLYDQSRDLSGAGWESEDSPSCVTASKVKYWQADLDPILEVDAEDALSTFDQRFRRLGSGTDSRQITGLELNSSGAASPSLGLREYRLNPIKSNFSVSKTESGFDSLVKSVPHQGSNSLANETTDHRPQSNLSLGLGAVTQGSSWTAQGSIRTGQDEEDEGDHPRGPTRPQPRQAGSRSNISLRFCCVFNHTNQTLGDDCGIKKKYVSQLQRHHERHGYYYCCTCFRRFRTAEERACHEVDGDGCFQKCVTRGCSHYGQIGLNGRPLQCQHNGGRGPNSQEAQWSELRRKAMEMQDVERASSPALQGEVTSTHSRRLLPPSDQRPESNQALMTPPHLQFNSSDPIPSLITASPLTPVIPNSRTRSISVHGDSATIAGELLALVEALEHYGPQGSSLRRVHDQINMALRHLREVIAERPNSRSIHDLARQRFDLLRGRSRHLGQRPVSIGGRAHHSHRATQATSWYDQESPPINHDSMNADYASETLPHFQSGDYGSDLTASIGSRFRMMPPPQVATRGDIPGGEEDTRPGILGDVDAISGDHARSYLMPEGSGNDPYGLRGIY